MSVVSSLTNPSFRDGVVADYSVVSSLTNPTFCSGVAANEESKDSSCASSGCSSSTNSSSSSEEEEQSSGDDDSYHATGQVLSSIDDAQWYISDDNMFQFRRNWATIQSGIYVALDVEELEYDRIKVAMVETSQPPPMDKWEPDDYDVLEEAPGLSSHLQLLECGEVDREPAYIGSWTKTLEYKYIYRFTHMTGASLEFMLVQ